MWIDHDKKLVFVAVPKCGSTSMIGALGFKFQGEAPRIYHASIEMILNEHPECTDYESVGFIRNPWDRVVSVFLDGVQSEGHQGAWSKDLLKFKNFEDFIMSFENTKWLNWVHFLPCSKFLTVDDKVVVNHIGRYENIVEDFNTITTKIIGSPVVLNQHHNKTNRSVDYRAYYNDKTKEIIGRVYEKDIELFNYEF